MNVNAKNQAQAQVASIVEMVEALHVDYDRLRELRAERALLTDELEAAAECVRHHHNDELCEDGQYTEHAVYRLCRDELASWIDDNANELAELEEQAGDCESEEDARQRIEEDALSVEVRSGWFSPGGHMEAEEFRIVLCTGGPHVEIVGGIGMNGYAESVRVLYQGWFQGKQELILDPSEREAVLEYANCFWFGQ